MHFMLGFTTIKGFFSSLVGASLKTPIILLGISIATIVATINQFVDSWIFEPAHAWWLVVGSYVLDLGLHVYIAIKAKTFQSSKAQRIFPKLVVVTGLLAFLYHTQVEFAQAYGSETLEIMLRHFRISIAFYIALINLLSFVATAGRNKLLDIRVVKFITKYVDTHKEQLLNKKDDTVHNK